MVRKQNQVLHSNLKTCPRCETSNVIKTGTEITKKGIFRRYRCKECGLLWLGELVKRFPIYEEEGK